MATLTNTQISVTYVGLLKTSANTVLSSTAQQITDGSGNNSILFLSTAGVGIGGAAASGKELDVTGNVLITGDLQVDNLNIDGNTISATSGVVTLSNGAIATTQSQNDNSTKIATTAYVDTAIDAVDTLAEILAIGNTTGATKISVNNTSSGIDFIDDAKARFGTGNDLSIYHGSSNSFIQNTSGSLIIEQASGAIALRPKTGENGVLIVEDGAVTLYHNNLEKLATTTNGIYVKQDNGTPYINLRRDDSTIAAADDIGYINFEGDDPSDGTFNTGARILAQAEGNWSADHYISSLIFQTRATCANLATVLTLASNKLATFAGNVNISGSVTAAGNSNSFGITAFSGDISVDDAIILGAAGATGIVQTKDNTGTNAAGGSLQLYGGRSTGTGVGGDIQFFVSPAGSSGTSANTYLSALHIEGSDKSATFTGTVSVNGAGSASSGSLSLVSSDSFIRINTTGGTTDKQKWDIRTVSASGFEALDFRTVNDANNSFSTKLSLAHSGTASFAGNITSTGTSITLDSAGSADYIADRINTSSGATYQYKTNGTLKWYHGLRGLANDDFYLFNNTAGANALVITESGSNATFAGIATANGFRTTSGSTDYSLLTRNSSNTAVYIQQAGSGDILDVRYGSQAAGQGTSAFSVNSSGNSTFAGTIESTGLNTFKNSVAASTDLDSSVLKLQNTLDGGSGIEFINSVAGKSKISFGVESTGAGTDDTFLAFSTSANTTMSERMRIDSSGDVFVGGTTTTNAQGWGREIASINSGSNGASLTLKDSNGEWQVATYTNKFYISKGATTPMLIDSSGNVGINETNPSSSISSNSTVLQISDSNVASLALNQSSVGKYEIAASGLGLDVRRNGTNHLTINTSGDTTFSGNVTLTKSVGDTELLIEADSDNNNENDNPRLHLRQDGGAISAYFGLNGDVNNTFTGALANGAYIKAAGGIQFAPSNTLALTLDTSQNATFAGNVVIDGFSGGKYLSLRDATCCNNPSSSGGVGLKAIDHTGSANDGLGIYGHDGVSIYTLQTERMRINNLGYVKARGRNTTAYEFPTNTFHNFEANEGNEPTMVLFNDTTGNAYGLNVINGTDHNNTTARFFMGQGGSTERIKIFSNGNIQNSNNSYGQLSDRKLKENIEDATPKLDDLMQVQIKNFNYIDDDTKQIGVIAQELQEVFPALVYETPDVERRDVEQTDEEGNIIYQTEEVLITEAVEGQEAIEWEDKPTMDNTKVEIQTWLDDNEIEWQNADTKLELLVRIPEYQQEAVEEQDAVYETRETDEPVTENKEVDLGTTTKAVKYSVFVPIMIKAMQEQQQIIEDLKARIEILENK